MPELNFYGPQASIPQNPFLVRINSVVELILETEGEGVPGTKSNPSIFSAYSIPGIDFISHKPS